MAKNKNPAVSKNRLHSKKWESYKLFLYVLPCLIFIFNYLPLWGWAYSFFQYKPGLALSDCKFVGLQNFQALFGNAIMRENLFRVLRNTFGIQLLNYLLMPVPMLFAIFLSEVAKISEGGRAPDYAAALYQLGHHVFPCRMYFRFTGSP